MQTRLRLILAIATLSQAVAIGVTVGVFPLFLEPFEATFDAPRTTISVGPILVMFALSIGSIVAGGVLDRGRVRLAMLFGTFLLAGSLTLAALAPNLALLGLAALGAGFSIPWIGPLAGMCLVTRLFTEDHGRSFGIMSMGPGLGSGFCAALAGWLLQSWDWRQIYLLLAVAVVASLAPLVMTMIPSQVDAPAHGEEAATDERAGLRALLRRPLFWLSALVFALPAGIGTGWVNHLGAFLGNLGLGETEVASFVAAQFWVGVPGALLFGMWADRFSTTSLFALLLGFEAAAFACYAAGVGAMTAGMIGVGFGFVGGGLIPLYMVLLRGRVEPAILGRAMGFSNLVMLPILAVSIILAASFYERNGNYTVATIVFSIGTIAAIVSLFASNRSATRA